MPKAKLPTKKKPKDDSDDDDDDNTAADPTVEEMSEKFYSWGGIKDRTSINNNAVAKKGKSTTYKQLSLDVVGNPFNIKLTYGATRRQSDDGTLLLSSIYISLPIYDVRDIESTNLSLDTANQTDSHGNSSIIILSQPIVPYAEVEAMKVRLEQYHKETVIYYKGNKKVNDKSIEAWNESRLQNIKALYAKYIDKRTKKGRVVKYHLKLPRDPLTGHQLYCHNQYWQGISHAEGAPDDSNYLAGSFQPHNTKQKINKKTINVVFMSLDYEVPLAGGEESELDAVMKSSKMSPKKDINRSKIDELLSNQVWDDANEDEDGSSSSSSDDSSEESGSGNGMND